MSGADTGRDRLGRLSSPAWQETPGEQGGWPAGRRGPSIARMLGHAARILAWAVVQFAFTFVEQIAEVLAPLALAAGVAWWALPHVLDAVVPDGDARQFLGRLPAGVTLDGTWITPERLIKDGLLLMAVVAACRTVNAVIAREA